MVLIAARQWASSDQQQDRLPQLRHVLVAFLGELHIAPELRTLYRWLQIIFAVFSLVIQ